MSPVTQSGVATQVKAPRVKVARAREDEITGVRERVMLDLIRPGLTAMVTQPVGLTAWTG